MTSAIRSYLFARQQQKMTPIDACTEAAEMYGIDVYALAATLRAANIDAARLSII